MRAGFSLAPGCTAALIAIAGCTIGAQSPEDKSRSCNAVANALAPARLASEPTKEEALAAADRLDPLLSSVRDVSAHDAVVRVHQHLHSYEVSVRRNDDRQATALSKARAAAEDLAKACSLPRSAFLGSTARGSP